MSACSTSVVNAELTVLLIWCVCTYREKVWMKRERKRRRNPWRVKTFTSALVYLDSLRRVSQLYFSIVPTAMKFFFQRMK